ncbi:MAG: hypothetical protein LBF09_05930, partial [Odoribacteraceae bacterium]|nr:hypothetical protein [Odoribacteraceae bacterium]
YAWATSVTDASGTFLASSWTTSGVASTTGQFKFKLAQRVATSTDPKTATVKFTTPGGTSTYTQVTITSHALYLTTSNVAANYLADGTTEYLFTVNSNYAWATSVTDASSTLLANSWTTSGVASTTGQFKFKLKQRIGTSTNLDQKTATVTFTTPGGVSTYKQETITSHAGYLTLAKYSHTTTGDAAHSFDVAITTNIPTAQLGYTNEHSMVTGVSFVAGPVLRVNVNVNTLSAAETNSVIVTWEGTTMQTLSVTVPVSLTENIGGLTVYRNSFGITLEDLRSGNYSCPTGSNLPTTMEQAITSVTLRITAFYTGDAYAASWRGAPKYQNSLNDYNFVEKKSASGQLIQSHLNYNHRAWGFTIWCRCVVGW